MNRVLKTTFQLLLDVFFFCLMVLGVGGVIYKVLQSGEWVEKWFGNAWLYEPGYAFIVSVVAVAGFLLLKKWMEGILARPSAGNTIMYGLILLGAYFAFRLLVGGSL